MLSSVRCFDVLNLAVQIGIGLVLFLTYLVIRRYTEETRKLAEAAVEQMPRPTLKLLPLEQNPVVQGLETPMPTVKLENVGSIVALNVRYQIRNTGSLGLEMDGAPEA